MFKIFELIKRSCQRPVVRSLGAGGRLASSFAFSLLFFCGLTASAQTGNISFTSGPSPSAITSANCNNATPLTFTVSGSVNLATGNSTVYVFVYPVSAQTGTSALVCPPFPPSVQAISSTPAAVSVPAANADTPISLTQTNFGSPTTFALGICNGGVPTNFSLCAYLSSTSTATSGSLIATSSPAAFSGGTNTANPTISVSDPLPGDTQISFTVTTNQNETDGFEICYSVGDTTPIAMGDLPGTTDDCTGTGLSVANVSGTIAGSSSADASGTLTWIGLQNETQYVFVVRGKVGGVWSAVQGPVVPVVGFSTLQLYQGSGGGVSWECAQNNAPLTMTSVAMLVGLFALAYFLSPSRRRRSAKLLGKTCVVLLLGLSATPSHADIGQWDLGLGATFYRPALDKGTVFPVYKCLYGDAMVPKLGLDFDWHVFDPFGSFQLGFEVAFTWVNGKAAGQDQVGQTDCSARTVSNTNVNMNLLMFNPRIRYVFDEFVEDFYIVPFVEGGINMTGYYFTYQGSADTRGQANDHDPLGIRFGWHAGGGFLFLLDWIEPTVSASARANGTYEHIYLKTQVSYVQVNDFGSPGYDFSPAQFGADIPLQLDFAIVFEF